MDLMNLTKKELVKHIKENTIAIDKYNKLQKKIEIQDKDIEKLDKDKRLLESQITVLEGVIKNAEKLQMDATKNIENQANKIIGDTVAKARLTEKERAYTEKTLLNTYGLIKVMQKNSNLQAAYASELIDTHLDSIFSTSEEKEGVE